MRKFFFVALFVVAASSAGFAQQTASMMDDVPNAGIAPREMNGIGRLDLRVVNEAGAPVKGASAVLKSLRTDGFKCESVSYTDARGIAYDQNGRVGMPPIHMGALKLKVKAKGYEPVEMEVPHSALAEPVRVTLVRKQ